MAAEIKVAVTVLPIDARGAITLRTDAHNGMWVESCLTPATARDLASELLAAAKRAENLKLTKPKHSVAGTP